MRRQWKTGVLALAVAGLSAALCAGQNVPPPSGSRPSPQDGGPHAGAAPRRTLEGQSELRRLALQLGLTPEQREKLRPIITDEGDQLSVVRLDEHMPPDQKRAKFLEIREAFRPKIEAVLTPEQQEKWKKLQEPQPIPTKPAGPESSPKQH